MAHDRNQNPPPTAVEKISLLWGYVFDLTSNPKRFPLRYRESIVRMEGLITDALALASEGEETYPSTKALYDKKITDLREALAKVRAFSIVFGRMSEKPYFKITEKQIAYVSADVTAITGMLNTLVLSTRRKFSRYDDEMSYHHALDGVGRKSL